MKPYRLVARLKNNRLWSAILDLWPNVKTQREAAKRLRISANELSGLLCMRTWPWSERYQQWTQLAVNVATRLGHPPDFLFDGSLYGLGSAVRTLGVGPKELVAAGFVALPPAPDAVLEEREVYDALYASIATLTPREQHVIRLRFGLGEPEKALEEISQMFGVTKERIRQIEVRALRKLRHPTRTTHLRQALYGKVPDAAVSGSLDL